MLKKIFSILAIFVFCLTSILTYVSAAELPYLTDNEIDSFNNHLVDLGLSTIPYDSSDNIYGIILFYNSSQSGNYQVHLFVPGSGGPIESLTHTYKQYSGNTYMLYSNSNNETQMRRIYLNYNYDENGWSREFSDNGYSFSYSFVNGSNMSNYVSYSTADVYNEDGSVFFQAPKQTLAEIVQGATEEALPYRLQDPTVGTMRVLVLCGVGLIALLMGLNLFGKVLPRFLNRS